MRIATAGMGLRASHVLSLFQEVAPDCELVGYYDPSPSHVQDLGVNIERYFDVKEMLEHTQPDLFFVCSPNEFHLEQIKIGLEMGVRIFTEKPVVTSIKETMELAFLLAKYGTDRVMVGLVLRHSQHMVDLRKAMAEGILGPIASLEANEHIAPYHGAFFMRDWRRMHAHSGGFMLEKCCHDLDLYNMITGSRPLRVASFGGRRSFLPEHAPASNSENDIFHIKKSVWNAVDDPFLSDGDIVDHQTALLVFESGASMTFHTNINTPDEHRRFCVMGVYGMAEGDFMRGFLKITRRDGTVYADHDYKINETAQQGHYGADRMMVTDIISYLKGDRKTLPVNIVDALQAGIAALAIDQARRSSKLIDLTPIWKEFDAVLSQE